MPNWVIGDNTVVDCGGMFSDCTRTTCIVINSGDGGGQVNVEMTVIDTAGRELSHAVSFYISPGDRKTASHDFVDFAATRVECTAQPL